jgi:uncharacterized UPF0146 family protein
MEQQKDGVTRRQLITTAAVGGAALIAGAVGGTVATTASLADKELEILKLRALVGLYENLEKVGIDAIIATGMNVIRSALEAVKAGVRLARDGVTATETALKNFQAMLDSLQSAAELATRALTELSQKFKAAESFVVAMLGTALPLAEAIANFFNELIKKIPFGVGAEISRAINALVDLIRAIPATLDTLLNQLLKPLREMFFPATGNATVKTNLFDPIINNLLAPLKKFLTDVETLLDKWENNFTAPVQKALDERAKIRKQIVAMRNDIGLV